MSSPSHNIDEVILTQCLLFAQAWENDPEPDLRPFITLSDGAGRDRLFHLLLEKDINCRRKRSLPISISKYCDEFPAYHDLILAICKPGDIRLPSAQSKTPEGNGHIVPGLWRAHSIPDYELLSELGRGSTAIVYRGRDLRNGREVAIRIWVPSVATTPQAVARFRLQAELAGRLRHSGVVQIYAIGEVDGLPFLSMELVDGVSLEQLVSRGPIDCWTAAQLVSRVADAVQHAHDHDIIHRDLKPGNVLVRLTPNGYEPKVTDFGCAKDLGLVRHFIVTMGLVGTPCYMAPEQVLENPIGIGPPTDVYGLGAILYQLVTGRPPFFGDSLYEIKRRILEQEPISPSEWRHDLPPLLESICLKCLRKDSSQRYGRAKDLRDDLMAFGAGETVTNLMFANAGLEANAEYLDAVPATSIIQLTVANRVLGLVSCGLIGGFFVPVAFGLIAQCAGVLPAPGTTYLIIHLVPAVMGMLLGGAFGWFRGTQDLSSRQSTKNVEIVLRAQGRANGAPAPITSGSFATAPRTTGRITAALLFGTPGAIAFPFVYWVVMSVLTNNGVVDASFRDLFSTVELAICGACAGAIVGWTRGTTFKLNGSVSGFFTTLTRLGGGDGERHVIARVVAGIAYGVHWGWVMTAASVVLYFVLRGIDYLPFVELQDWICWPVSIAAFAGTLVGFSLGMTKASFGHWPRKRPVEWSILFSVPMLGLLFLSGATIALVLRLFGLWICGLISVQLPGSGLAWSWLGGLLFAAYFHLRFRQLPRPAVFVLWQDMAHRVLRQRNPALIFQGSCIFAVMLFFFGMWFGMVGVWFFYVDWFLSLHELRAVGDAWLWTYIALPGCIPAAIIGTLYWIDSQLLNKAEKAADNSVKEENSTALRQ